MYIKSNNNPQLSFVFRKLGKLYLITALLFIVLSFAGYTEKNTVKAKTPKPSLKYSEIDKTDKKLYKLAIVTNPETITRYSDNKDIIKELVKDLDKVELVLINGEDVQNSFDYWIKLLSGTIFDTKEPKCSCIIVPREDVLIINEKFYRIMKNKFNVTKYYNVCKDYPNP